MAACQQRNTGQHGAWLQTGAKLSRVIALGPAISWVDEVAGVNKAMNNLHATSGPGAPVVLPALPTCFNPDLLQLIE